MKIQPIGTNQTLLIVETGVVVFVSYETPVAAFIPSDGYLRSAKFHSKTTSRHINKWLDGIEADTKPQEYFDTLYKDLMKQ